MPAEEITIRTAGRDETNAVLAFWREAAYGVSPTDDVWALESLLVRDGEALLLAVDRNGIAGSIIAGWDGWRGNLYRLAVLPARRRQAIGARLVREAEQHLLRLGARRIGAIVEQENERAREFWTAQGYALAAAQARYFKDFD